MAYFVIWFILSDSPGGYIEPQEVQKTNMSCGLPGQIVGVQLNKLINPTKVLVPDPGIPNLHCEVDITERMVGLVQGTYHLATTIMGDGTSTPYIGHDPHTSDYFSRVNGTGKAPAKPSQLIIKGQ